MFEKDYKYLLSFVFERIILLGKVINRQSLQDFYKKTTYYIF